MQKPHSGLLKSQSSKILVGSIHSANLNYHREMHAFDSSIIPSKAKQAVEEIKELVSADILNLQPPKWNKSTYVDRTKNYSEQLLFDKKNFEIRMGFRDQQISKERPNKIYPGTETRNSYTNWNISNYIEPKDFQKKLETM